MEAPLYPTPQFIGYRVGLGVSVSHFLLHTECAIMMDEIIGSCKHRASHPHCTHRIATKHLPRNTIASTLIPS